MLLLFFSCILLLRA